MNRTHKKYRVKSRCRFVTFLVIVVGLMVGAFGFVSGSYESTASETSDYTTYTVVAGDTVWDIAEHVQSNTSDTRRVVYTICQLNEMTADELQPGMVLTIPTDL